MNLLGLFSGIGGFELGFQRAGFTIAAMCEIDPYCRAVLAKHWPGVPLFDDVRALTGAALAEAGIGVDVITGGFPCQDLSVAGRGGGLGGERSGLWFEYLRLVEEIRPAWVVVENVSALRSRGLDVVLGGLAALGYDAEWHCIPAAAVGAPHCRDRVWIIARRDGWLADADFAPWRPAAGDADTGAGSEAVRGGEAESGRCSASLADGVGQSLEGRALLAGHLAEQLATVERGGAVSVADGESSRRATESRTKRGRGQPQSHLGQLVNGLSARLAGWDREPEDVPRVAKGVPDRVARLKALGNAVVPQIPELIARAILRSQQAASISC